MDLDQFDELYLSDNEAADGLRESLYNRIRQDRRRTKPRDQENHHTRDDRGTGLHNYIPSRPNPRMKEDAARFSDDQDPEQGSRFSPATGNARRHQQGDFDAEEPSIFPDGYESPAEESDNKAQRAHGADDGSSDTTFDIRLSNSKIPWRVSSTYGAETRSGCQS